MLQQLLLLLLISCNHASQALIWGSSCSTAYTLEPHGQCFFPSQGAHGKIVQCKKNDGGGGGGAGGVSVGSDAWWCPTTSNYCADAAYKWCPATASTFAGSDPGRDCHFPFWYKGVEYRHCLRLDTAGENYLWCSTTPGNYSGRWTRCRELPDLMPCHFATMTDPQPSLSTSSSTNFNSAAATSADIQQQCVRLADAWTCRTSVGRLRRCPDTPSTEGGNDPGRPCHFPFSLGGSYHRQCVNLQPARADVWAANESRMVGFKWCATTDSFDRDRLWTRCRQPIPPGLSGLRLLLVAAGGLLSTSCVAACVLYCSCEPSAPLQRCLRRRRRRQISRNGDQALTGRLAVGELDVNAGSGRGGKIRRRRAPSPTAPHADELDAEDAQGRLPTYEEVLALSAMEQVLPHPPPPPPLLSQLFSIESGGSVVKTVSFDDSGGVPV